MIKKKLFAKKDRSLPGWNRKTYEQIVGKQDKGSLLIAITSMDISAFAQSDSHKIERNFFGKLVGTYQGSPIFRVRVKLVFDRVSIKKHTEEIGMIYGGYGNQMPDEPDPQLYVMLNIPDELELELEKLCIQAKTLKAKYVPIWLNWSNLCYKESDSNKFDFQMTIEKMWFQQNIALNTDYIFQDVSLEEHVFSRPIWNQK